MENLQPPFGEHSNAHPMEHRHTATEDSEAVLSLLQYEQEHMNPEEPNASLAHSEMRCEEFTDAQHDQTQPIRMDHSRRLDAENMETSAASQMNLVETSLPKLHEELEDSRLRPSSSAHINNVCHPPKLPATLHFPTSTPQPLSPPLNVKPVTLFTNNNPSFVNPHLNPSWPVLVPHLNPYILSNASVPHHNPFCPIYTPKLNFNLLFKPNFKAPVACEDHSYSSLVLQPHLNIYPVCPTPNIYHPNVQMIRTNRDDSGRFPGDLQDSFRLWQRLCGTARLFCSSSPDAEALACFFMRIIPSLSVYRSDLPFTAAVNTAVQEWRNTSNFDREPYYNTARTFIELEEQDKSANRDPTIPQTDKSKGRRLSSGKVIKTGHPRSKKVSVKDLAENALSEYSQVMDALESKVTDGSEVTVADEEDVCALFLNQLLKDSESTTEAGFDIDFISSLLSTDVLKDNAFPSMIPEPEPVAGCSDWTHTMVSEAQILPPSAVQHNFNPSEGTNLLSENNTLEPFLDDVKGQNAFQTLTEPLLVNPTGQRPKTDPNTLIQETIHPELQDFGPEADGNQKDETLFVAELDCAAQSNCFSLQNYNSHQATFTLTIKHEPETPIDGGMEENMVVRQKTEEYMHVESPEDNATMDSDIPNDSQRRRNVCNKQKTIDKIEENNVNRDNKHKRWHRRQKHQKITLPAARTSTKSDDRDARRLKTAEHQSGKTQKSTNAMKHEAKAQETDFKIQLQQRMNITETTSSATEGRRGKFRQHDKQIGKIREHLDDGLERRQRQLLTKAERDSGKTYRWAKKQENVLVKSIEEDRGEFHRRTDACQRLRRKM